MQAAAAVADSDLDLELMVLVERSTELVGARGGTAYTLRFVHGETDLLLRVAVEGELLPRRRLDRPAGADDRPRHPRRASPRSHDAVVSDTRPVRPHRPARRADPDPPRAPRPRPTRRSPPPLSRSDRRPRKDPRCRSLPRTSARPQAPGPRPDAARRVPPIAAVEGRVLDPATALAVNGVRPAADGVRRSAADDLQVGRRRGALEVLARGRRAPGLERRARATEDPRTAELQVRRAAVCGSASPRTARRIAPDGWTLLQQTRAQFGVEAVKGVGLDHVVFREPVRLEPVRRQQPVRRELEPVPRSNPPGVALSTRSSTYAIPGWGGRQPVAYVGPPPRRRTGRDSAPAGVRWWRSWTPAAARTRGSTAWSTKGVELDGHADRLQRPGDRPRDRTATWRAARRHDRPAVRATARSSPGWCTRPARTRTSCPGGSCPRTARSSSRTGSPRWPRSPSWSRRHRDGRDGRAADRRPQPVDGLLPRDARGRALRSDAATRSSRTSSRHGTLVVCSAGNDATSRPSFPAAFAPWSDGNGPVAADPDCLPIVSVGRAEPERQTDALFSNAGPWVRPTCRGAAVMSTIPPFQGGLQPMARTKAFGRVARVDRPRRLPRWVRRSGAERRSRRR